MKILNCRGKFVAQQLLLKRTKQMKSLVHQPFVVQQHATIAWRHNTLCTWAALLKNLLSGQITTLNVDVGHLADKWLTQLKATPIRILTLSQHEYTATFHFISFLEPSPFRFSLSIFVQGPWAIGALPGEAHMVPHTASCIHASCSVKQSENRKKKCWI